MSWKRLADRTGTLAFRLALLYAVIFVVSSAAVFWVTHVLIQRFTLHQMDLRLATYWYQLTNELEMDLVPSLQQELTERANARGTEKVFYQILDENGKTVASSDLSGWSAVGVDPGYLKRAHAGETLFATAPVPDLRRRLRVLYAPILDDKVFLAGVSMSEFDGLLGRLSEIFAAMVLVMAVLGVSVGWQMARRAMSGVEEVTRTASVIAGGRFDLRVNVAGQGREIAELCRTFNVMLEYISRLIRQLRDTGDAIAHDLRTPVTRIRGAAETTILSRGGIEEYRVMAANIIEETELLLRIINTNLEISEAEAGLSKVRQDDLDLGHLVREAASLFSPLCEQKGISLSVEAPESLAYTGDVLKIRRVLANLMDNAVKFTPSGGRISVRASRNDECMELSVADTGPGIPAEDAARVFTRFLRLDESRNTMGNGLGLALARSMAHLMGGDIRLESEPGCGSTFTLTLPLHDSRSGRRSLPNGNAGPILR